MSKLQLSDEERKRRSERARALNKEGKLGGPNMGQGRKKKMKANEKVAEEASRHSQKIIDRLLEVIENGSHSNTLKAIEMWLRIEADETAKKEGQKQSELESKSKDELIKYVVEQFVSLQKQGKKIPGFDLDVEAKEIEQGEIESGA